MTLRHISASTELDRSAPDEVSTLRFCSSRRIGWVVAAGSNGCSPSELSPWPGAVPVPPRPTRLDPPRPSPRPVHCGRRPEATCWRVTRPAATWLSWSVGRCGWSSAPWERPPLPRGATASLGRRIRQCWDPSTPWGRARAATPVGPSQPIRPAPPASPGRAPAAVPPPGVRVSLHATSDSPSPSLPAELRPPPHLPILPNRDNSSRSSCYEVAPCVPSSQRTGSCAHGGSNEPSLVSRRRHESSKTRQLKKGYQI